MDAADIKQAFDKLSTEEKQKVSELLFDALSDEEKEGFSKVITGFLNHRTALGIIHQKPPAEQMAIILALWAKSTTSEWFIQKIENDSEFQDILQLFRKSKEQDDNSSDKITRRSSRNSQVPHKPTQFFRTLGQDLTSR